MHGASLIPTTVRCVHYLNEHVDFVAMCVWPLELRPKAKLQMWQLSYGFQVAIEYLHPGAQRHGGEDKGRTFAQRDVAAQNLKNLPEDT